MSTLHAILPTEVWFCITEHLDHKEIQAFIGVNQFFFNVGMDARYGHIDIDTGSPKFVRDLSRMKQPQVAKRVKRLELQLTPLSHPWKFEEELNEPKGSSNVAGRIRALAKKVVPGSGTKDSTHPTESLVRALIAALTSLKNVKDFRIVTWAFPDSSELQRLYTALWDAFGHGLRRVSFCANMEGHRALIESNPSFSALETLELEFSNSIINKASAGDLSVTQPDGRSMEAEVVMRYLVPFVTKLSFQTKTLKIRSFATVDLSPFFSNLDADSFASLESLLIGIPFNLALRSDPSGFATFLHAASSSLTQVFLRLTPLSLALDPGRETSLCEWLESTVSDPRCFAHAQTLDICPTSLPAGMNVLRSSIANSAEQLQRFVLRDRYLRHEELLSVVEALKGARSLTYLRLNVFTFNIEVIDAFAEHLPTLRELWLSIGDGQVMGANPQETLRNDLKTRRYTKWKLWDLSLWQSGGAVDHSIILAIAESVPSIESFWGQGHKGPCADD